LNGITAKWLGIQKQKIWAIFSSQFRAKICHKTMKNIWQKMAKPLQDGEILTTQLKNHIFQKSSTVFLHLNTPPG
jgi:hypothetical protein